MTRSVCMIVGTVLGLVFLGGALPGLRAHRAMAVDPAHDGQTQTVAAAEGTVERFILDPRGEVEGVLLSSGTYMYITSRAAEQVVRLFKPGDHVQVYGRLRPDERQVQPDVIKNLTSSETFTVPLRLDLPMQKQEFQLSVTEMSATGTIRLFFYHPLQRVIQGMLLSDNTQIRLPPDASQELRTSLHLGEAVTVKGNGTSNQFGRAIEAVAIGRDSGTLVPLDPSLQRLP